MSMADGKHVRGWGVVHKDNVLLHRIFDTKAEADECVQRMGLKYIARLGDNPVGTDDFVWAESDNA